ncbi:MAG: hypothetical protein HOQ11_15625 [Gemmatimonadaceae bacterium]|nr:hypothetical protein [Gemmatimonadaceae bacterium]NUQ91643.1 hypothetical protein [Gemmatimonadaceae bacterium]NUR18366.1 hypothetical protein [Gemmatimonadaceae bacterium]NUS98832.1 hypothetical protein [Gemmatimonadaceae bacterium]
MIAASGDGRSYGTITIVGGGCYGGYYLRQLHRGRRAGAIDWERLVVVDRDPACAVARTIATTEDTADLVVAAWDDYFDAALAEAGMRARVVTDAIVPSPLMPHLALSWLERRARDRVGADRVARLPLTAEPQTPWQRAGSDGTHYASYATWTCPVNCVEPVRCPVTRGHRAWSMPDAMRHYVASLPDGERLLGPLVFHCSHRAFGVGMIDVADLLAADAFVARHSATAHAEFLVATVSHCHGALGRLAVG